MIRNKQTLSLKAYWRDLKLIKQSSPIPVMLTPTLLTTLSSLQPAPDTLLPISSGPNTRLVTVNKLVKASYTDTGPIKCTKTANVI